MNLRMLLAVVPIAVLLSIGMMASESDADERFVTDDGFVCQVDDDGTVNILSYDPKDHQMVADLIVPENVDNKGKQYTVTKIFAIFNQDGLRSISIPKSIVHLETPMFEGPDIEEITIDPYNPYYQAVDSVIYSENMFNLEEYPKYKEGGHFDVPEEVIVIKNGAFTECQLESITLPSRLFSIERNAFFNCYNLTYINNLDGTNCLPDTVNVIDEWAFCGCVNLDNLKLSEELRIIGASAFKSTGLKTVDIPFNLSTLGSGAFANCLSLERITCSYNPIFKVQSGVLFKQDGTNTLMCYPANKQAEQYTIDASVTDIAPEAFAGCQNLKTVRLPTSMILLSTEAFKDCESLQKINLNSVWIIGESVFEGCKSLESVTFGSELISIGQLAFAGSGLKSLTITNSIEVVDVEAFASCEDLELVEIAEECAAEIGNKAFLRSFNLSAVSIYGDKIQMKEGSLDVGDSSEEAFLFVVVPKGYSLPDNTVTNEDYTHVTVQERGERPYPYENFVAIFVCLLIIIGIFKIFRGV